MKTRSANTRTIWAFFLLVLLLSLPIWAVGAISADWDIPIELPISALQAIVPVIAASILVYRENRWGGVWQLLKRTCDFGRIRQKRWYLPIIGLWPLIMLLSYAVMRLIGAPLPEPLIPVFLGLAFLVVFFISGTVEQLGWQGYLYERIQPHWNALAASVLIGAFWGLWHVVPFLQQGRPPAWIVWQTLGMIPFRVLIVWLFNNTGNSVFATIVFQATANVSQFLFPNLGSHYDPLVPFIFLTVAAAIVIILWGHETLAQFRFAENRGRVPKAG